MAHDRMTNDDLDRKMGGREDDDLGGGQRTPGRNPDDQQTGQKGAGQNKPVDEDDDLGGETGRTPQGGQNR